MSCSTDVITNFCVDSKVTKMGRIESFYLSYFFFSEFIAFSAENLPRALMLTKKLLCLQPNSLLQLTGRFKINNQHFKICLYNLKCLEYWEGHQAKFLGTYIHEQASSFFLYFKRNWGTETDK